MRHDPVHPQTPMDRYMSRLAAILSVKRGMHISMAILAGKEGGRLPAQLAIGTVKSVHHLTVMSRLMAILPVNEAAGNRRSR